MIKINGTLTEIPYKVTVMRGFPMGKFVFHFMDTNGQGDKLDTKPTTTTSTEVMTSTKKPPTEVISATSKKSTLVVPRIDPTTKSMNPSTTSLAAMLNSHILVFFITSLIYSCN